MKKYAEVYDYFKKLIENGALKTGDRLPSIRNACNILSVSKTTVQNAYFDLLADGYIISVNKSGYYVTEQKSVSDFKSEKKEKEIQILYDLKSGDADEESFDIKLWQRYIKSALRSQGRLLSYSEVQGEADLRQALAHYIREKRNVTASPDRIIVGAGVQWLLSVLCSLVKDRKTVSFPDKSFVQGMSLFEDYGYDVHTRYKDADIIYVSPSHMTAYGDVMTMKRRLELIDYSEKTGSIIIEDDFDSDFLYQSKPTPSLYALSGNDNVVYMGSFSNVLIPGIRISFMVLTQELAKRFEASKYKFAQTASKTEQIALCQYIRDGHISSQTRKVRRHYTSKARLLFDKIKAELPDAAVTLGDNGLRVLINTYFSGDISDFEKNKISVSIIKFEDGKITLSLTPSAIKECDIPKAVAVLKSILN